MSVEENVRVIDARIESVNAGDLERFFRLHAGSIVLHVPGSSEPAVKGRSELRELVKDLLTAFPDAHVEKVQSFGQGDWVCLEYIFTGTHQGPYEIPGGGIVPATHRKVRQAECEVFKVERGEITEIRLYEDELDMMRQLGAAP